MSHQQPEHGGGDDSGSSIPVKGPNTSGTMPQKLPTLKRHRLTRSSSDERFQHRRSEHEQSDSGFSFNRSIGAFWPFVSTDQFAALQGKYQALEEQARQMSETHGTRERELRERLAEKEIRLSEKETELEELKKTLCMYNDCSEVEVQSMVGNINTKIQSLSCNTAMRWYKTLDKASDSAEDGRELGDEEVENIGSLIGVQFVEALRNTTSVPKQHQLSVGLLLPLAWRACISATVARVLSSFSASLASTNNGRPIDIVLRKIGDEVMTGEAQPAYGRWRLVTHQYLRRALSNEERTAIQAYVNEALANCRIACRLVMKNACPNDQDFTDTFQTQLHGIMEDAFGLLTTIQEKMITANYEPYTPLNGEPFDAESMVVDKQDKTFPNDRVVCTTGVGLRYWWKEGRESTSTISSKSIFKEAEVFTEGNLQDLVAS